MATAMEVGDNRSNTTSSPKTSHISHNSYSPHNSNQSQTSLQYNDVSHSKEFLSMLDSLRTNEELCDVVLLVGNLRLLAHKVVLASCSAYFKAMFTGHLRETDMKEIPIHIKEEDAFEQIIDYFYTSKLDINQSNVQKLIIVAGLLQLRKVQQACCDFVKRKITSENCLGIAAFADSHSCVSLAETATNYAVYHFVDVVQGDEFLKISGEQLNRLITDDALNVQSEERVFEAVVAWIQHDKNNRMVNIIVKPVDTARKLNVYKTFRRRPGCLLNALYAFNLCSVFKGIVDYLTEEKVEKMMEVWARSLCFPELCFHLRTSLPKINQTFLAFAWIKYGSCLFDKTLLKEICE